MDPWTDEQEIALLKAVVKWKPVGMHKHFRMLAIRDYMDSQGVLHPDDDHTKVSGIWLKLGTLYDLATLDEREDSIMHDGLDDDGEMVEYYRNFELPDEPYYEIKKEQKFQAFPGKAGEGSQSPEWQTSRRGSTVADTDEPRSSPVSGRGSARGVRASARKGRTSKLQNEVEKSRRTSKATSMADDETMDNGDEDDEHESVDVAEDGSEQEEDKRVGSRRGGRAGRRGAAVRGGVKRLRKR